MSPRAAAPLLFTVLACAACDGPRDATPMPEPPSMDLSKVGPRNAIDTAGIETTVIPLAGQPGTAPPGSLVRVTPLDNDLSFSTASVDEEGGFSEILVNSTPGSELRFQVVEDGQRSEPQDAFYLTGPAGYYLSPSLRHACVRLAPGFEVTFVDMPLATLSVHNGCGAPVTLSNARSRTGNPGSRLSTPLPLVVQAGDDAQLSLEYQGSAFGASEDILFVDVTLEGRTFRYPITLFAP